MEENKALDDFIRKSVHEVGLESPSQDFTNLVLSKIKVETERSAVFIHEPLLSKSTWLLLTSVVVAIFGYVIFVEPDHEVTWLSVAQMNRLASFNLFGQLAEVPISNTFLYGILAVTFFVCIQILILKKHFDKQYNFN